MVSKDIQDISRRANQQELINLFRNLKDLKWLLAEQTDITIDEDERANLNALYQKIYRRIINFAKKEIET